MRALLFVDMLGVKARWLAFGKDGAQFAFKAFRTYVQGAIDAESEADVLDGFVESDSAALVCRSTNVAVSLGRSLYVNVFMGGVRPAKERFWLRGVIAPHKDGDTLRSEGKLDSGTIKEFVYTDHLLSAIAAEKSGVKGMRLLIANSLVDKRLRRSFSFPVGDGSFVPFRTLTHSSWPKRLFDSYQDFLWMVEQDEGVWQKRRLTMAARLREAARSPEESVQAAATQVLFHECSAILGNLKKKAAAKEGGAKTAAG